MELLQEQGNITVYKWKGAYKISLYTGTT